MSTLNEENLVSVNDINEAIGNFIGKHPENVTTWINGKTVTIQLSNIGVRDKLFSRLAYLVENTTIENDLILFNMPAKCVYASNQIIRFTCTINELISSIEEYNMPSKDVVADTEHLPNTVPITRPIKKFYNRLTGSNTLKKAQSIINKSSHKIKVYIISNPHQINHREKGFYVTWEVIGILKIDANTTWNNESFIQELNELKATTVGNRSSGNYGAFNIAFGRANENSKIVNDVFIKQLPEFIFDSSIKVGDTIDSCDYVNENVWCMNNYYQEEVDEYFKYDDFYDQFVPLKGIDMKPYGETLIPDGAIITI